MSVLGFWNQWKKRLKKQLRRRKSWLHFALFLLVLGIAAGGYALWADSARWFGERGEPSSSMVFGQRIENEAQPKEDVVKMIEGLQGQREAYSQKIYICGEEVHHLGVMSSSDILAYYKQYPSLSVQLGEQGEVYFTEQIDDLSPQCKNNAYFGLDANGNLSLFEGVPGSSGQVIRTFFQLNIEFLESSLPRETVRQLYRGIRITDLAEYNSVLSTFSDFAVGEAEEAMRQGTSG